MTDPRADLAAPAGAPLAHDSAVRHVTGEALYVDDLPEPAGLLHAALVLSPHAHARIAAVDLGPALVRPGVVAAIVAADIPGANDVAPIVGPEPILADGVVEFAGQPVAAVAATSLAVARDAARRVRAEYAPLEAVLDVETALARQLYVSPPHRLSRGDAAAALARSPRRLAGEMRIGGQDHFYLEGQIAMAVPRENGEFLVHSSTQHPTEVQKMVAQALGLPHAAVTVEVRRMGGGFGGKETQPAIFACIAAVLARRTGRPVKLRLDRDEDMLATGKRHDFLARWDVGFDDSGRILALDMTLAARAGHVADLSPAVLDRALFHAANAYFVPDVSISGYCCRTHTQSNTAFRGFGGPQGMLAAENVVDAIARALGRDPLEIRRRNFYAADRDVTPYHQRVEDFILPGIVDSLAESAAYHGRRREIAAFNAAHDDVKRGLALSPVMFGISFTATQYNQAGALVHVFTDGSVQLNHGGTEMGQGLHVKVQQVVAAELGVDLDAVRIMPTSTEKIPNTSATAASAGTDLNGMAAADACRVIRRRLTLFAAATRGGDAGAIRFAAGRVQGEGWECGFAELVLAAYKARLPLSAAGFYATPKVHYDRARAAGRPFYYFAYGAAVVEAEIDLLTGEYRFARADLLHDVGRSLNPAIDLGQIEGGFLQGLGWLTSEELWWDGEGRLRTHAPSTYKIPTARDLPADFRVATVASAANREETIHRSKAVGEPPLMLAIAGWLALKDAVAAATGASGDLRLDAPATPEEVLRAIERARRAASAPQVAVAE